MIVEAALILGAIQLTLGDREHKIHNIVLYPERYSWCKTTAIKQVVATPGYESVTIDNNVCVGACYSYSIPITRPAEPGELIRPYCDSCQPAKTRCYHVTLNADSENTEGPKTIKKRIQIITNCQCTSCEKIQNKDCEEEEETSELPSDLFSILHPESINKATFETKLLPPEEVPELLQFEHAKKPTELNLNPISTHSKPEFKLNSKLINLLKSIQIGDEGEYDRDQVKELYETVQDTNHLINDKKLIDFVNFVNSDSEDFELDLTKLKDVLLQFKKSEDLFEKHRNFGLGLKQGQENNFAINTDLENLNKNKVFGLEGSHHGLAHAKGNHIGMGLFDSGSKINLLDNQEVSGKGHHHLGEKQHIGLDLGHLVRGPHGSLAFTPDVKQKLNLETDLIKPNQEGMVISYENSHSTVN
ncbi:hypothetical protein RI129_012639 [Pyrocoelia pectoralis]|uniref:CTCK domain-containing protein n=1 Tax=Pyrocoelia pectoralis TaxID=417401 RepID=A0AAN7V7M5_9COLE